MRSISNGKLFGAARPAIALSKKGDREAALALSAGQMLDVINKLREVMEQDADLIQRRQRCGAIGRRDL